MPQKQIGEGAEKRANKTKPTIGFRCPSVSFKHSIQEVAKHQGVTVNDFLIQAVSFYLAHIEDYLDNMPKR